jgi:hypothetical protein
MRRLKVGDLVCYNGGGMRKKSLGLVMATHVRTDNGSVRGMEHYVLIHWTLVPTLAPRAEWSDPRAKLNPQWSIDKSYGNRDKTKGWYFDKGHFEILS